LLTGFRKIVPGVNPLIFQQAIAACGSKVMVGAFGAQMPTISLLGGVL